MEVLVELNLKQRVITRMGIVLMGITIFTLFCTNSAKASLILGAFIALLLRSPTVAYAVAMTLNRDLKAIYRFAMLNIYLMRMERRNLTIAKIFALVARRQPDKACFILNDRKLSYAEAEQLCNKVAGYFRTQGLQHGDCVGLFMETCVEYPCLWLGLSQLGVITALINSNLRGDSLIHSIRVANVRALIVGSELIESLPQFEDKPLPVYQFNQSPDTQMYSPQTYDLSSALAQQPQEDLRKTLAKCKVRDKLIYVYTSGTTGLPKAAVITNLRFLFMGAGPFYMLGMRRDDIVYNPLPLYHTAGGIVGVGNALLNGATVVLRKKFSATNFWLDCDHYGCTVAQYIGELCRYLLATPYTPEQRRHNLRLMYGNGLRPQIWTSFVSRFGIPQIGEIYGATEGNSNLINITSRLGAIGFVPVYGGKLNPAQVIRCNEQTGEPLRDSHGLCIKCAPGEAGLLVGKVDPRRAATAFHGYSDRTESEKKLLRNVYGKGDVFFNSGDMVVLDILGYCYFKDRTGDTFRWRGENVATQEVEAIITSCVDLRDCVVYGVAIPHVEGKAGMAAIVDPLHKVDMEYLSVGIRGSLPTYARPLFIRLLNEIPSTSTFKMKKFDLANEGYDLGRIKDPIYYLNRDGIYRMLTQDQFTALQSGTAGL